MSKLKKLSREPIQFIKWAKSYPVEYAWDCPYCDSKNYSEDRETGEIKCCDCDKIVKVY